jgi:uncharacterized protein YjbI with pentapeptide repeats
VHFAIKPLKSQSGNQEIYFPFFFIDILGPHKKVRTRRTRTNLVRDNLTRANLTRANLTR